MYPAVHTEKNPEKPAVIIEPRGDTVTYKELNDRSNQMAQLLWDRGLRPRDHIAIFMENHPRFHEVCWAAQRSGLYYTAISSRLTAPEVAYIVNDCEAQVLVTSAAKGDVAAELGDTIPNVHTRLVVDAPVDGFERYEDAVAAYPAEPIENEVEGSDMLYSSGTTGRPKGVKPPLTLAPVGTPNAMAALAALSGVNEDSLYLSPAPLYHSAPLRFTMAITRVATTSV